MSEGTRPAPEPPVFTTSEAEVIRDEQAYIAERRRAIEDPRPNPSEQLWGLCVSGGGVRSATFALGVVQALTRDRIMQAFDYLSTVSGGGYLGSAITSLLSGRRPEGQSIGLDYDRSPFLQENAERALETADRTRLGARSQLDHLRSHGEYLARRGGGPLSLDVQRIVGMLVHGIGHNLLLYVLLLAAIASAAHLTLSLIDERMSILEPARMQGEAVGRKMEAVIEEMNAAGGEGAAVVVQQGTGVVDRGLAVVDDGLNVFEDWWRDYVYPPIEELIYGSEASPTSLVNDWPHLTVAAGAGGAWVVVWLVAAGWVSSRLKRSGAPAERAGIERLAPGFNREDQLESRFVSVFNASTGVLVAALLVGYGVYHFDPDVPHNSYSTGFFVPIAFFVAGMLGAQLLRGVVESWVGSNPTQRSLSAAVGGAMVLGAVASTALPVGIVLVFSATKIGANNFLLAFGALGLSYYLSAEPGPGAQLSAVRSALARWRFKLIGVSVAFAAVLGFSWMLDFLITGVYPLISYGAGGAEVGAPEGAGLLQVLFYEGLDGTVPDAPWVEWLHSYGPGWTYLGPALVVLFSSLMLLSLLGVAVDSNRISPHYFYRDRLSEAYLTTGANVAREDPERRPGQPVAILRDDRQLRMHEVGDGNSTGPYHLIVTSINLAGARERARKALMSEHFIFSKRWVGSTATGWVRTGRYLGGETKLARAMTISAAAASSGAGLHTSRLWAFVMTLFNVRLGYWMENPWFYGEVNRRRRLPHERRFRYWPRYLWREMLGAMDARGELVNLSDGGHTGDNLGLLPLLYRRCRVIVVCDGECDPDYAFGSFAAAVRLALIEQGIEVDIDMSPIAPRSEGPEESGRAEPARTSATSVVAGRIRYPRDGERPPFEGRLVYVKASLPADVPLHVKSYAVAHPGFPHQSTGDQFFDNAQFEAYRALGETIGAGVRPWLEGEEGI